MSTVLAPVVTPFKGLAPFEDSELDALLFFGRERETEVIVANMLATRLTVLYGPSGVGKSSILRAAVARRLREAAPGAEVHVLDEWAADPALPAPEGEAYLILDQFEEYFLYHDPGPLHDLLPALLEQPRVHILIAVREDAVARLDAFQARVPGVFANRLRLDQLDPQAARAAVLGPLDRWNAVSAVDDRMGIETALVEAVLHEVETSPGRIEAPYLQLVLERVWEAERDARSPVLRRETLARLGGAEAIVSAHLERALGSLPSREAEIATSALKFLVTPSRTKIAHSFGDLVGYTNESPVALQQVLEALASQRILRAVADGEEQGSRYEIFHDVLAEPVLAWRREFEARAALAAAGKRHRRLAIVAGGALLLALAMVALSVYAFAQRGEASKQKRAAVVQKDAAVAQKKAADRERLVADAERRAADTARRQAEQNAVRANANAKQARTNLLRAQASEAVATQNAAEAKRNAAAARRNNDRALRQQRRAEQQALIARRQTQLATERALFARVGELVARAQAMLGVDPVQSIRASLAASRLERSDRVEDALRTSLLALEVHGILAGGGGAVNSAAFSPDGSLVATGAAGGTVRIFRARTNALERSLTPGGPVDKVVFSPDGSELAAAAGKNVVVYDVRDGRELHTLPHAGVVLDAVFAGGGRYLVTGSADRSARVWDVSAGELLFTFNGGAAAQSLAVSPNGALVAVLSRGQPAARVYDVQTGAAVATVTQPGEVTALAFSPNGQYLVTTGRRNGFVWDTTSWQLLHQLTGHEASITCVAFAPDGRVVTGSVDSSGRVWDPGTGASLFTLAGQHQQKLLGVAVSPDGRQIATASADETVRIWNAPLGSTPRVLGGHTDSVTSDVFSPDGSLLLTTSADGTARLWKTQVPALATIGLQQGAISSVAFSPDGALRLSAGADGTARLWGGGKTDETLQQGGKVTAASFTPNGALVLTAGDDGTAKTWHTQGGALAATYPHGAPVRAAVVGPHGDTVVTAGDDGRVRLWSIRGPSIWTAQHGSAVAAVAVSRDGVVASGAKDGTVRLWRGSDGAPLRTLRGLADGVTAVAFSADGTLVAAGSSDHTARVWNVETGGLVHVLVGHSFAITSISFSPDARLVLTSSVDGDARLWSVATGKTAERLKFHVSTVSQAAFSPDGRWVVTAGPTTAAVWQVRTGRLLYYVGGAHGNLTAAAWAPDSLRIVTGDTGGGVESFTCGVCGGIPSLVSQAGERLAGLVPGKGG